MTVWSVECSRSYVPGSSFCTKAMGRFHCLSLQTLSLGDLNHQVKRPKKCLQILWDCLCGVVAGRFMLAYFSCYPYPGIKHMSRPLKYSLTITTTKCHLILASIPEAINREIKFPLVDILRLSIFFLIWEQTARSAVLSRGRLLMHKKVKQVEWRQG